MKRLTVLSLMVALLAGVGAEGGARGADPAAEILVQRALDGKIDLNIPKEELSKVFEQISDVAKVSIVVDQEAYDCLPYGPTTKVTASFQGATARAAIDEVLTPLGLEQSVSGATVIIKPMPAVARIGRRAEWEELQLLAAMRTATLTKLDGDWTPILRGLLNRNDLNVRVTEGSDKGLAAVKAMLPCTVAQAMDVYAAQSGQVWTVRGRDILMMPMRNWIEGQLERPIALSFTNAPLMNVVAELGHLSRVNIEPAPGLYQAMPNVTVNSNNDTLLKTLNALSGATGIPVDIKEDRIVLGLPVKPGTPTAPKPDAIVGRVNLWLKDGTVLDLYIHESDLPADVAEARRKKLQEAMDSLRKAAAEGTTTTQPMPALGPVPAVVPGGTISGAATSSQPGR